MSQRDIAQRLGVAFQSISQYERDIAQPKSERLPEIARLLKVSVEWLVGGAVGAPIASNVEVSDSRRGRRIMVMPLDKLGEPVAVADFIHTRFDIGEHGYAVTLVDNSMDPEHPMGDIIALDPDLEPRPGDKVCARVPGVERPLFRKLRVVADSQGKNGLRLELQPLNENWPTLKFLDPSDVKIVGVMTEFTRHVRR